MLGTVLKIDRLMPRGKFARIYVEVDSEKQLVSRIKAREHTYYVEYEGGCRVDALDQLLTTDPPCAKEFGRNKDVGAINRGKNNTNDRVRDPHAEKNKQTP
ncbi:hypothetical protein JHK87_040209 [Glycine soja]|nr:hypothetical protein JHK87_040209 [Glycine soja]